MTAYIYIYMQENCSSHTKYDAGYLQCWLINLNRPMFMTHVMYAYVHIFIDEGVIVVRK